MKTTKLPPREELLNLLNRLLTRHDFKQAKKLINAMKEEE